MNWEVQTMPSKTSFCNGTEFRKCLSRWWPLWVIYGVILFIMLPGVLLNARSTIPYVSAEQSSYLSNVILSETQMLLPLTAFCAGLLAAAAMFGYLYTPRGAGLAASLPIRRGCMFRTHLLAGLLMLLSAEAVIFGLAVLIEATRFELVIEPLLIWLGILALETVVFYGIAVLCAMFTALVAVCSQIAIPMPWGVPINLALFAVYMAGTMLGPVWGAASQLVYLLLAAVGVPVMAGMQGGPAVLLGKTGGYAIGYLLAALIAGAFAAKLPHKFGWLALGCVVGCAACYVLGTIWFMVLTGLDLPTSLTYCVIPYLPGDVIKIALASLLTIQLDKRMPKI